MFTAGIAVIETKDVLNEAVAPFQPSYRPLVFVSHAGVYFCARTLSNVDDAIREAQNAIREGTFNLWHHHKMEG